MTVVAAYRISGHPLMLADLLLSGPVEASDVTTLPSVDVAFTNAPSNYEGPVGLCQKIVLIGDNLVIGWAGKRTTAMDFISELQFRSEYESFNPQRFDEFIKMQPPSTWREIRFTGFISYKENSPLGNPPPIKADSFGLASDQIKTPSIGNIFIIGSGRDLLVDYFKQIYQEPPDIDSHPNLAVQSVLHGTSTIGDFLSMEHFARESLDVAFGGGYELAVASHEKFVKLNMLYVFWRGWASADYKSFSFYDYPFLLFRYEYINDLLVIRTIAMQEPAEKPRPMDSIFLAPPVYRYLTAEEKSSPPSPPIMTDWICNFVQVIFPDGTWKTLTLMGCKSDWLKFKEENGQVVGLSYSDEFKKKIIEGANKILAKHKSH